ncbi:uncharacterized protein LOC142169756 [Nicotiana tabacum]|uniref:Uncharacterized protein LOC142169756 n=1 Tax=Nicotiana tabacum TaxID=4097 RepID=A0AC58SS22_TOBAC
MPHQGKLKLNTDGSFNKQNGKLGIGGILRNEAIGFVMSFSIPIDCSSNNGAELKAIKFGYEWCINKVITNFMVEIDSTVIRDMLQNKKLDNNILRKEVEDLTDILEKNNAFVNHRFSEANQVADWFAKEATTSTEGIIHTDFRQVPRATKGLFFMDMWKVPSFRIRYKKLIFL